MTKTPASDRWRSFRVILYRTLHLGVILERGLSAGGEIVQYIILCEWDVPGNTLDSTAYTCMLISYRRVPPHFQFSLSGVTLVYLSQWDRPTQLPTQYKSRPRPLPPPPMHPCSPTQLGRTPVRLSPLAVGLFVRNCDILSTWLSLAVCL